jgi:hypothetical protein
MVENNCNNNTAEFEVPNIVNTNNDKDKQNITKTTESVEVPPHNHTTQATNATMHIKKIITALI